MAKQKRKLIEKLLFEVYDKGLQMQDCNLTDYYEKILQALNIPFVSNCPSELEPVLAKIEHINSLGKSSWYEVVYFDEHWRCYAGSDTFKDGEKVVKWRYCKDCC